MHLSMFAGTTSKIVQIPVYDSSSTTGGMLTGLVFNTASLVCWYNREGAAGAANQISLLTATKGTWTTAGFVAVDGTNQLGWYELHVPNAAIAAGAKSVSIQLRGATNMVPVNILIELTATDNQDSVRGGMTALPNAAAAASGGLVVLGTNATAISFTGGMTISSTTGNALALSSSGGNGDGLAATGNGTGAGIHLVPGATGNGLLAIGGATSGTAIKATGTAGNAIALELVGQGSAAGLSATGGATGIGITAVGGATSGSGLKAVGTAGNAIALEIAGQGSAAGIQATGGATGSAFKLVGGGTSGHGLAVTTTAGDGFNLTPTAGNAITATANGTSKHGIVATGGTGGTSDGASFIAGTGGVDFRANQTGNVTGNLSGTVTTVTTTTTATNLTNAPTAGDLTSTMKTSVENAVWDAARSSHIATGVFGQLGLGILRDNTATAGAASTITLDGAASTTADFYKGAIIALYSGTGAGQAPRTITAYSTGRVATISPAWAVTPDATSKFLITAFDDPVFVGTDGRVLVSADSHTSGETVAAVTGNVGGNVVGSVGSVTGAVGSVTGAVGSVTGAVGSVTGNVGGSVASVTARVTANADQWAGTTIPAPTVTGVPKVDLVDIAGATVSTSTAQLGVNAVQIGAVVPGSATIGTVTTTTTATNLTNAPTAGDFTAAMKTSLNAATPASITGAVGSVTADVGITQAGADKVWSTTTRALTDKIGFALSSAGVQAIWDALTSALTTVGSIGKLLVTDIDAAISSRSTYAGGDTSGTTTLLTRLTGTRATNLDNLDAAVSSRSVFAAGVDTVTVGSNNDKTGYRLSATGVDDVWDELTSGHTTAGTTGKALIDAGASGSDPWDTLLPGSYAAGSAGNIVGNNLDATVSSRSTYAGADTSGTTTLLGRLTSTRAGLLDNLDAAVSTRSSHSAADVWSVGTRTLTAFTIAVDITSAAVSLIWDKLLTGITTASTIGKLIKDNLDAAVSTRSTYAGGDTSGTTTLLGRLTSTRAGNLDNLDAAITTRLASAGYTAPDNSDIVAIKAKTDNLPASPAAVSDIPTASANASATWDAVRASHTTSGTFGQGVSSVQGNVTGSTASVTADVGITQAAADKAWGTATRALTDKAGFALTSAYDPAKTAAQAGDAMALTSGERDSVAVAALKLDWTGIVGEASRSTLNALRFLRNKWSFAGTTLTVTAEDDTTSAWTGEVTTSGSAQPITSVDPT